MAEHNALSDSTAEVGYEELEKLARDTTFAQMLLTELNLVELPGYVFEDNTGDMFLSRNPQVKNRAKKIDLKYNFIREFAENKNGCKQDIIQDRI